MKIRFTREILRLQICNLRLVFSALLVVLSLVAALPAHAQLQNSAGQQTKAYRKAARKSQKNMQKYDRQQQKAMKKSAKAQQKSLKKLQQRGWTVEGWPR